MKAEISRQISKNNQILNIMKIRPVEAELLHADGRTDRRGEVSSRFSQLYERAQKVLHLLPA